jgi:XTP/dITP diphosphohydrolase
MTNRKFINRFNYIEAHSIKIGKPLNTMTLEEMDKLWEEAKASEE